MGHRFVSDWSDRQENICFFSTRIINPAKAMNELGWRPRHVGFVEEIDIYYKAWAAHKAAQEARPASAAK